MSFDMVVILVLSSIVFFPNSLRLFTSFIKIKLQSVNIICLCSFLFSLSIKDYLYEQHLAIQTLIHTEKKKKYRERRGQKMSFSVGRLESKACSNIFEFLRHFTRRSIQTFGNHFLFINIQMIVLFAKITIENILNKTTNISFLSSSPPPSHLDRIIIRSKCQMITSN